MRTAFTTILLVLLALAGCTSEVEEREPRPWVRPAKIAPSDDGTFHIADEDRCPVTALAPADHPAWAAALTTTGGRGYYFVSPKHLFRALFEPETILGIDKGAIAAVWVRGHATRRGVDARGAFFVAGSRVRGPYGPEMIPFEGEWAARAFNQGHGGKGVFAFSDVGLGALDLLYPEPAEPAPPKMVHTGR